jgi:hypothetical protein
MSNTCLVTRLKGVVANDKLSYLGTMSFKVKSDSFSGSTHTILAKTATGGDVVYEIIGNGYFTDSTDSVNNGKTITIHDGETLSSLYHSAGNYTILVRNKYCLGSAFSANSVRTINASELNYCNYITTLTSDSAGNGTGVVGNVSDLPAHLTEITIRDNADSRLVGSVEDFTRFTQLSKLIISTGVNKIVRGNISVFGPLTYLTQLYVSGMSGTIEGFVAAQRANGRTSVSSSNPIALSYLNEGTVTFNGSVITSGQKSLYWTASQITFDGVTITA